ncbi:hypothetical protein ACHQM5_017962 [Ranunculus cassubicifolius]
MSKASPFSTVLPSPSVSSPRRRNSITLETIKEEESLIDNPKPCLMSSPWLLSFPSQSYSPSQCFVEAGKVLPTYGGNCKCS